jgi:hypothetical protein
MIAKINDLKSSIDHKTPRITVSKAILASAGGKNSPWVEVGFGGFAETIQVASLFVMSFFSARWNQVYVQKKLQYRYAKIGEDDRSVTFKLTNKVA